MRLFLAVFFLISLGIEGFGQSKTGSKIQQLGFGQFEPFLHKQNDSIYVINFWATWCVPCRKELPVFERIGVKYRDEKIKVLLVSLDFPKQLQSQLIPFVNLNKLKSEIVLLNEPNANDWIDKVDPKWSGSIPFTLIYGKGFKESYEHSFTNNELDSIINSKIKKP
jgi:thiol-disulfide isomerase/thioredoxin